MQENTEPPLQVQDSKPNPNPRTPHRGRGVYPSNLAKGSPGRVPLHKRGTSGKYERLEDLLREAGYKETRIFTPETERHGSDVDKDKQSPGVARMSAVLSFVSGLVSWSDSGDAGGNSADVARTQSLGRAALKNVQQQRRGRLDVDVWAPPSPTPKHHPQPRKPFAPIAKQSGFGTGGSSANTSTSSSHSPPLRPRSTVPDARTTLRHMMSTPDFTQRPDLRVQSGKIGGGSRQDSMHRQLSHQNNPPMPSGWLQTVTQAVMRTSPSAGAYVGGPAQRGRVVRSHRNPQHTPLADHGTRRDGSTTSARKLLSVHACRAASTPSIVTTTSVVCRSAPGSRASSRVRDSKGRKETTRLPSLGATAVDADSWPPSSPNGLPLTPTPASSTASSSSNSNSNRHSYNRVSGLNDASTGDAESDSDSDSGELDLARILLPPKRQQSIQSLRKHLHAAITAEAHNNSNGSIGRARAARAAGRPRSSHGRESVVVEGVPTTSSGVGAGAGAGAGAVVVGIGATKSRRGTNSRPYPHAATLKMAPGLRGEFMEDDSFEVGLEQDKRRSRRGSIDETGDSSGEWAVHGMPGLQKAARVKKGSTPWTTWAHGKP